MTRISNALQWQPQVPIEEGVRTMLDHIDYWREAPVWNPATIADATKDWFRYLGPEVARD